MHELDDGALELELRRVLSDKLGTLPLELTAETLERRRTIRDQVRRRRRVVLGIGLAAAMILPAGWIVAGAPMLRPPDTALVITPAPSALRSASPVRSPSATSNPTRPIVEELGAAASGQLSGFGSALLADGRVLLVGGADTTVGQETLAKAWLFDPETKRIVPTGAMASPRTAPLVVSLSDGRVLVIGGWREDPSTGAQSTVSTVELYDPATGTFAPTAALPDARRDCPCGAMNRIPWAFQHATQLADGRVFLAGGDVSGGGGGATMADVFDPTTEHWGQLDIGCDAARGAQALLLDGRLLVICVDGGADRTSPVDVRARLFDPTTGTFTDAAKPPAADSAATALADGRILLTGREPVVYDPSADAFRALPTGPRPDQGQAGIQVPSGRVLFLGDQTAGQPTLTFDPGAGTFTVLGQPGFTRADAVVPLRDGRVLTVGYRLEARLLDPGQLP
jgi:hypothetical protein